MLERLLNRLLTQAITSMNVIECDFTMWILTSIFSKSGFLLDPGATPPTRSGLDTVVMHPKLRVDVEWRVSPRLDMRLRHVIEMTTRLVSSYTKFIILTCVQCNGRK